MESISLHILAFSLVFFILLSAFFSGAETGMMSLNRYRLRHLARKNHRTAKRVTALLQRVDRLLGVILIGNTFANILAASFATIIAVRLFGDIGVLLATIGLTLIILIFAEITPKTIAATYPERVAFIVSIPLTLLLKILYPLIWLVNIIVAGLLKIFRFKFKTTIVEPLSYDELATVVKEAGGNIPESYQDMLLSILNLKNVTVDDIMIPRNEIIGIDVNEDWQTVLMQLTNSSTRFVVVYRDNIDHVQGILPIYKILNLALKKRLTKSSLLKNLAAIYFIPEGTSLTAQLLNFRQHENHVALVVDEYGDIQGLVTLTDILEEIAGKFTSEDIITSEEVCAEKNGSFLLDGSTNIRELNREMGWDLPVDGPKTISGLIVEYLEAMPKKCVGMRIGGYPIEIITIEENMVKTARIFPKLKK